MVEKIARSAIDDPGDLVFEIGPGIGALTQFLCEKADRVVASKWIPGCRRSCRRNWEPTI